MTRIQETTYEPPEKNIAKIKKILTIPYEIQTLPEIIQKLVDLKTFPPVEKIKKPRKDLKVINICVEGPTGNGKSSIVRLATEILASATQTSVIMLEEPAALPVPKYLRELYSDKQFEDFRDLCKGVETKPERQVMLFMLARAYSQASVNRRIGELNNELDTEVDEKDTILVPNRERTDDAFFEQIRQIHEGQTKPKRRDIKNLVVIQARGYESTGVYQAALIAHKQRKPLDQCMKSILEAHDVLFTKGILQKADSTVFAIDPTMENRPPSAITDTESLSEDQEKDSRDAEKDIFQKIFPKEFMTAIETNLYLRFLLLMRENGIPNSILFNSRELGLEKLAEIVVSILASSLGENNSFDVISKFDSQFGDISGTTQALRHLITGESPAQFTQSEINTRFVKNGIVVEKKVFTLTLTDSGEICCSN